VREQRDGGVRGVVTEVKADEHSSPWLAGWAVFDQGVVSLGTFLTSIVLARSLSPAAYGMYSALLVGVLFFNGIHTSLVTSPLSVEGSAADGRTLSRYSTAALLFTIVLAVPSGLVLAVPAGLVRNVLWIWVPVWLASWQLQETMRRSLMCGLGHSRAVLGDAVSYLGQAALVWAVWRAGFLTLERALAIMALTSALAAAIQAVQVGLASIELAEVRRLARDFWKFGSWMLYGCLVGVVGFQAFFWLLALSHGPKETASLQAVANLLGVCHPLMFGLGNVLVPVVAKANAFGGLTLAWRSARRHGAYFGVILLPYFVVLLLWPRTVLETLYGSSSPYAGLVGPLRLFVASYALLYIAQVIGLFLTGIGNSRATFQAQLSGAVSAVLMGLPLAWVWGVPGACAGLLTVNGARSVAASVRAYQLCHQDVTTLASR
jgi:O-antigen/teichoic acid export membrane protein